MYRSPDSPSPQRILQQGKDANYSVYMNVAAGELRMNKQARRDQQKRPDWIPIRRAVGVFDDEVLIALDKFTPDSDRRRKPMHDHLEMYVDRKLRERTDAENAEDMRLFEKEVRPRLFLGTTSSVLQGLIKNSMREENQLA